MVTRHIVLSDSQLALTRPLLQIACGGVIKKAKQSLAVTYHPDKFNDLKTLYREIATRCMQEVNEAVWRVRKK
jgi:hypothetical protein